MTSNFICIGGLCFGATVLNRKSTLKLFNEIKSPINNARLRGGFMHTHKLFDGTFRNTILNDKHPISYKYKEGARYPHLYFDKNYIFPHIDLSKQESRLKLAERYNSLMDFIKDPQGDYWYVYSLTMDDINLTVDEINVQLNRLSKYINVNRIIFLGSKLYTDDELVKVGVKLPIYSPLSFNARNENFRKVVGDRYFVIEPSNAYDLAARRFIKTFNRFKNKKEQP